MNKNKQDTAKLPFNKKVLKAGIAPNVISATLVFVFEALFMGMTLKQLPWALLIVSFIVGFAEFVFSPITNGILTTKLTKDILKWETEGLESEKERTSLFESIMSFPLKKALQTFLYFFVCSFLLAVSYHFIPVMGVNIRTSVYALIACLYGSYFAGLVAFVYSEKLCKPMGQKLVQEGIDNKYVHQKKYFGMGLTLRAVLYVVIPSLYISILYIVIVNEGYQELNGKIPTP